MIRKKKLVEISTMWMLLFFLIGSTVGRLKGGSSSPWLASSHTHDHDYDTLTPDDQLPVITNDGKVNIAIEGKNATLLCDIERLGEYSVIWEKDDTILWVLQFVATEPRIQRVIPDPRIGRMNTSLHIVNVTVKDEGKYSCELNTDKDKRIVHHLVVHIPPSVSPKNGMDYVKGRDGETVSLECEVSGWPYPKISWRRMKDNKNMDDMASGNVLTVINATSSDSGSYACVAKNSAGGPIETIFTLDVQHAPTVYAVESVVHSGINYDASLLCYVEASPFPKVDWYKEGAPVNPMRLLKGIDKANKFSLNFGKVLREDFGLYSCNASNYYGNDSAVIELTGTPLVPKVTSESQGNFTENYTLTWEVKSYAPITSYFLFLKNTSTELNNNWVNITVPGTSSTSVYHSQFYILNSLSAGQSMTAKLKAINEFGESEFSDTFNFQTFQEESDYYEEEKVFMDLMVQNPESSERKIPEHVFQNVSNDEFTPEILPDETNETNSRMQSIIDEEIKNMSSTNGVPTLTRWEKRSQMMSIVTAISLSCFFYLFAMR